MKGLIQVDFGLAAFQPLENAISEVRSRNRPDINQLVGWIEGTRLRR